MPFRDFDADLDLQRRLVSFARRRGLEREEAEDLAGEAWLRTWKNRAKLDSDTLAPYAFKILRNLLIEHWGSPARILAKRIGICVRRRLGTDPIEAWEDGKETILGLASMKKFRAFRSAEVAKISLGDFLQGNTGLVGANPLDYETRQILERFFAWLGKPVERNALIGLLAPILVERKVEIPFDPDLDLAVEPSEPNVPFHGIWAEIKRLPTSKMRASILLAMDEPALNSIQPCGRDRLPDLIDNWTPPPPLTKVELPTDDALVARCLNITKIDLHTTRSRARKILHPALHRFLDL